VSPWGRDFEDGSVIGGYLLVASPRIGESIIV
jgi:hypothetical protein